MTVAAIGLAALLILVFAAVPLGLAMAATGTAGLTLILGVEPALGQLGRVMLDSVADYGFSILPLFLLMANFIARSGLAGELYAASYAFVGHRRGGLAMSTVLACGGFSTVSGSSLATAATMAPIAMPEMEKRGYATGLAAGSIAAGGTLGILIPPSVILVIYGNLTETDIGRLFIAGIIPGLIGLLLYLVAVDIVTRLDEASGPAGTKSDWPARAKALRGVWGMLVLFVVIIGGIYAGLFTPTEAAGIGAIVAMAFALARRKLSVRDFVATLADTVVTTAALLFLVAGSQVFATFVNVSGLPYELASLISGADIAPWVVVTIICAAFLVLGCVLEAFSMILLLVPIVYPIVQALGFDLVWFGIVLVVVVEIGLITPPVGLNVYVLRAVLPDVPLGTIFRGVVPFIVADLVRLALFVAVPSTVLLLPRLMD